MALWFWIVAGVFSALSLIGNGFTIFLIISRRQLFTVPNWFVLSLALADLFFVLCYFPASLFCNEIFHCNREQRVMVASIFMYASVANLAAMTIDRYIAIAFPLRYVVLMTSRRALAAICSMWLSSTALAASEYFVESTSSKTTRRVFEIMRILAMEVTPVLLLVIAAVRMLIIRRKHQRQAAIQASQLLYNKWRERTGYHVQLQRKRVMSSVQMICAVVFVFIVCYAVNMSLSFCFGLEVCDSPRPVQDLLGILLIVNSLVNPYAYAFLKRDIKRECKVLLCRKWEEKKEVPVNSVDVLFQWAFSFNPFLYQRLINLALSNAIQCGVI